MADRHISRLVLGMLLSAAFLTQPQIAAAREPLCEDDMLLPRLGELRDSCVEAVRGIESPLSKDVKAVNDALTKCHDVATRFTGLGCRLPRYYTKLRESLPAHDNSAAEPTPSQVPQSPQPPSQPQPLQPRERKEWANFLYLLYSAECRGWSDCWQRSWQQQWTGRSTGYPMMHASVRADEVSKDVAQARDKLAQDVQHMWQGYPAPYAEPQGLLPMAVAHNKALKELTNAVNKLVSNKSGTPSPNLDELLKGLAELTKAVRERFPKETGAGQEKKNEEPDWAATLGRLELGHTSLQQQIYVLAESLNKHSHPHNPVDDSNKSIAESINGLTAAVKDLKPPAAVADKPVAATPGKPQVDPEADFSKIFPGADQIAYTLLLTPDPRVPRHRRSYDLSIASSTQAMLFAGYVLDRYAFPWQDYLDDPKAAGKTRTSSQSKDRYADDGSYGVLVFRRDGWRNGKGKGNYDIRVVFVVAETASFGVQKNAMAAALAHVLRRTQEGDTQLHRLLCYPSKENDCQKPTLTVIGPAFSGSLTSAVEALRQVDDELKRRRELEAARLVSELLRADTALICSTVPDNPSAQAATAACPPRLPDFQPPRGGPHCWLGWLPSCTGADIHPKPPLPPLVFVSPATTAASNENVSSLTIPTVMAQVPVVRYERLSVKDSTKLENLDDWIKPKRVVLFAEASVFGAGLCPSGNEPHDKDTPAICGKTTQIHFPANIADIRYGQRQLELKQRESLKKVAAIPIDGVLEGNALELEDGAENGSEFPESQRSPLTTVSASAALDEVIRAAVRLEPQLVIVAATDVRDRLFLFDRLRRELPGALLVDLETDLLMSHPRFIHASRGNLLLGSSRLTSTPESVSGKDGLGVVTSLATDDQAMLYAVVSSLCGSPESCKDSQGAAEKIRNSFQRFADGNRRATLHLPTRHGLVEIDPLNTRLFARCQAAVAVFFSLSLGLTGTLLLAQSLRMRRCISRPRQLAWSAFATSLLLVSLWLLLQLRSGDSGAGVTAMPLLSGVNPLTALLLAAVGALWTLFYILGMRAAFTKADGLNGTALFAPGHNGSGVQQPRQNIVVPPDLTSSSAAVPALLAFVTWLWLTVSYANPRLSLIGRWEYFLYFAQVCIALSAVVATALSLAWAGSCIVTAKRIDVMARRANADGLPPWSALPGFGVGVLSPAQSQGMTALGMDLVAGEPRLDAAPASELGQDGQLAPLRLQPRFAATPLLAASSHFQWLDRALSGSADPNDPAAHELERLSALQNGFTDNLRVRALLALVLARQVEAARHSLYHGLFMALLLPLLAFSYPISGADAFALFGLVLVVFGALHSALLLYRLQHLPALDRLLCNGDGKTKIEYQTITALLAPLLTAAFAWALVEVPGVLDWSGGIFDSLLKILK